MKNVLLACLFVLLFVGVAHAQEIQMFHRTYQQPGLALSNQGFGRQAAPSYGYGGYGGRWGNFGGGGTYKFETRLMDLTVQRPFPNIVQNSPPWGGGFTTSE